MLERTKYKKIYPLRFYKNEGRGSVTLEINNNVLKITLALNSEFSEGLKLYIDNEKLCDLYPLASGKTYKRLELNPDNIGGKCIEEFDSIRIEGRIGTIAHTSLYKTSPPPKNNALIEKKLEEIKPIHSIEVKKEVEDITDFKEEIIGEEIPSEEISPIYLSREEKPSFSTDFSAIITRFKEQMDRLMEAEIISREELNKIEGIEISASEKNNNEYDEFIPFLDGDKCWTRICPDTLWTIPNIDIRFPRNRFCIYGQKEYKHLILKELKDRYRVGVPDTYNEKNVSDAFREGFYAFGTRLGKEAENGDLGYWLSDIKK